MKIEGLDPNLVRPRDWYRQRPEWANLVIRRAGT